MVFITILLLSALSIAGSAAFFTIYGLGQLFTSSFLPVAIMGAVLEAGKLVAASYAYRYWEHIKWYFKPAYIILIFGLMGFTSIGVFGYLSASYQKDVLPLDEISSKIAILEQKTITIEKLKNEQQINQKRLLDEKSKEIAALPANYATKKKEVAESYKEQLNKIAATIDNYNLQIRTFLDEKQELKISTIQQQTKTGPIIFIAQVFDLDPDRAVKWLIILIVIIFDPLAVLLIIGANVAIVERVAHKRRRKDDRMHAVEEALDTHEIPSEPTITDVEDIIKEHNGDITAKEIREIVTEMSSRELSPTEIEQKQMLEELLKRKTITERIRNPK